MSEFTATISQDDSERNLRLNLSESQAMQRQLINNFSHELRTPLTVAYGYMQSIQRRSENLTTLQKNALEVAIFEMECTIQLVQESLELARLDMNSMFLLQELVSLNKLVSEAITVSQNAKGRKIVIEGEELNIIALIDPEHLKRVLLKLIDNAIRYSDDVITIRLEKLNESVAISICDLGYGIPIEDLPHIFNPFYRVDKSRSRNTGGSGLGLAFSKRLVEKMGGILNVYSQLGEGSIFQIIL